MKITLAQIDIQDESIKGNANKIMQVIKQHQESDIILFPELCITGFPQKNNIDTKYDKAQPFFEKIQTALTTLNVTVILGHIEKADGLYYNASFLISADQCQVIHRKSHLWIDDIGIFSSGQYSSLTKIQSFTVGCQICFDLEFPEGSRALACAGADIIVMPNGNMKPYGNTHFVLSQARAIENQVFVITCNRVGNGHGGEFVGESLAVSPSGEVLLKLNNKEEIATITLNKEDITASRKQYKYINHIK